MSEQDQSDSDIHCAVCGDATRVPGYGQQFGTLQAFWGYARSMMASGTRCICASPVSLRRWRICGRSVGFTPCLMTSNRQTTRCLVGSRATTFSASRNEPPRLWT